MELSEIMQQNVFAVAGDTLNEEKYAFKIKNALLEHGYTVYAVGKELSSFDEIPGEIDVIDLCIHPAKALKLITEYKKAFKLFCARLLNFLSVQKKILVSWNSRL